MESQQTNNDNAPDTSHMAAQVVQPKKSHKKLYLLLPLLVLLIAGLTVGGLYGYKTLTGNSSNNDSNAAVSPSPSATPKTEEDKATEALVDAVQKETEALTKSDDSEAIKNSTAAATSVGKDIHEEDLED